MNIYKSIRENILRTWLLLFLIFIIIVLIGWIVSFIFNSQIILYAAIVLALITNIVSYYYSDKLVILLTGAKPLDKKEFLQVYQIVENLCIASGLPLPKLYIIETPTCNAFATGRSPQKAAIVFTRGILKLLERSELEGVIAHELSHIKNKDILVGTIAAIAVSFIAIVADFALRSWWLQNNREERNINPLILLISFFGLILIPLVAQLIQLAISRQREFLADASGALLTRYPEGLAKALIKISQNPVVEVSPSFSHLFIINPFKADQKNIKTPWYIKIWLTHPPVEERVARLLGRI